MKHIHVGPDLLRSRTEMKERRRSPEDGDPVDVRRRSNPADRVNPHSHVKMSMTVQPAPVNHPHESVRLTPARERPSSGALEVPGAMDPGLGALSGAVTSGSLPAS